MAHSSTVQVLKVVNESRKTKKGEEFQIRMAEVVLYTDEGEVEVVGPMRLSESLLEGLKPGYYRAGFTMERQGWGDNKGDIVSRCVSLTPVPMKGVPTPAASAPAQKAA
jgi:hypothetical protein